MIKKVKIKSWEQFEEEFCIKENIEHLNKYGSTIFVCDEFKWYINNDKRQIFGKEIAIEKISGDENYGECNYTHKMMGNVYGIHELWFEPEFEDFLDEDEFIIK